MTKLTPVMLAALRAAQSGPLVPLKGGFWVASKHKTATWTGRVLALPDGTVLESFANFQPHGTEPKLPDHDRVHWGTLTIRALVSRKLLGPETALRYPYTNVALTATAIKLLQEAPQ